MRKHCAVSRTTRKPAGTAGWSGCCGVSLRQAGRITSGAGGCRGCCRHNASSPSRNGPGARWKAGRYSCTRSRALGTLCNSSVTRRCWPRAGRRCWCSASPRWRPCCKRCPASPECSPRARRCPSLTAMRPFLSLPRRWGTTLANLPARVPYLTAVLGAVTLPPPAPGKPLRIGFAWAGNPANGADQQHSMSLAAWLPLLAEAPATWLQPATRPARSRAGDPARRPGHA